MGVKGCGVMNYDGLLESIVALHQESSGQAALAVNRWLILRNWVIGGYLVEFEQKGEDRAKYGAKLLAQLARDLKRRSVPGSSAEMLGRMRLFYRAFPQLGAPPVESNIPSAALTKSALGQPSPLVVEDILRLSWTHWIELLHLDDPWKRAFYENECLRENWSVRQLQRQIGSLLYERTALSTDKFAAIERARQLDAEAEGWWNSDYACFYVRSDRYPAMPEPGLR